MGELPFALLSGQWQDFYASIAILYRGTQILLEFDFSDQTEPSLTEYRAAVHPIHNPDAGLQDALASLLRILVRRVEPVIDRLVDTSRSEQGVTLQGLLLTPHYRLYVDQYNNLMTSKQPTGPTLHLKPLSLADLRPKDIEDVPRIPASDVVFHDFNPSRPSLQSIVDVRNHERAFFKPVENGREAEIIREINIQRRLQESNIRSEYLTSALIGITTATRADHISGILFQWIPAKPLAEIEPERRAKHLARWRTQVAGFIKRMHAAGLVWGDVNECNILVDDEGNDKSGNAWTIDFGGKTGTNYDLGNLQQLQAQDWREFEQIFNE